MTAAPHPARTAAGTTVRIAGTVEMAEPQSRSPIPRHTCSHSAGSAGGVAVIGVVAVAVGVIVGLDLVIRRLHLRLHLHGYSTTARTRPQ